MASNAETMDFWNKRKKAANKWQKDNPDHAKQHKTSYGKAHGYSKESNTDWQFAGGMSKKGKRHFALMEREKDNLAKKRKAKDKAPSLAEGKKYHKQERAHEAKDYESQAKSGHHDKKTEGAKSKTNKATYTKSQKKHIDSKATVKAPKKSFGTTANVEKAKSALSDRKSKRPGLTRQTVPGA